MQNTRVSQEQTGVLAGLIIMNESLSNKKKPSLGSQEANRNTQFETLFNSWPMKINPSDAFCYPL